MICKTLTADHGLGPFSVDAVIVGKMCAHPVVSTHDRGFMVAHVATLYAFPGNYKTLESAVAAASEIDAMADWDAIAPACSPMNDDGAVRATYQDLGRKVCEVAKKHGATRLPKYGQDDRQTEAAQ